MIEEAYKSQVSHEFEKSVYFYKLVLGCGQVITADDHARLAYSLEHTD